MNKTTCCSYFLVCSAGEMHDRIGFVASKNSGFDPRYITEKLKIEPFQTITMNEFRNKGSGAYPFSKWMGCRQDEPTLDPEGQCLKIVPTIPEQKSMWICISATKNNQPFSPCLLQLSFERIGASLEHNIA